MTEKHMDSLNQPLVSGKDTISNKINLKLDTLSRIQIFGYSIGHFQNDLCAACWFNYMLYFIKNVVFANSSNSGFYAGVVFLSGQIADGISTPLVGFFSDKTNTKLGKRTPWYIGGTIIVTISFLFIFQECLFCQWFDDSSSGMLTFYYIFFPSLFNVGWASVQVSHMSLVPSLTLSRRQRDRLNTLRNTFTYIANLLVLAGAFLIFLTVKRSFEEFSILSFVSVGLGFLTSLFFLFTLPEKKLSDDCIKLRKVLENTSPTETKSTECRHTVIKDRSPIKSENYNEKLAVGRQNMHDQSNIIIPDHDDAIEEIKIPLSRLNRQADFPWKKWFTMASFYIYGIVYMGSRILVNVQSSLIIFYLQNVLGIARGVDTFTSGVPLEFALIPMLIYLSSTITSLLVKRGYEKFGRKRIYAFGTLIALINAIVMMFLEETTSGWMFGLSIFIGFSQSVCLNTGITLISEVVGVRGSNAAFVFGAYSLLDKFANGIILYAIMNIKDVSSDSNILYTRICSSIIPACGALCACIFVIIGHAKDYDSGDIVTEGSYIKTSEVKETTDNYHLNNSEQKE